jgi:hypothetical protein
VVVTDLRRRKWDLEYQTLASTHFDLHGRRLVRLRRDANESRR